MMIVEMTRFLISPRRVEEVLSIIDAQPLSNFNRDVEQTDRYHDRQAAGTQPNSVEHFVEVKYDYDWPVQAVRTAPALFPELLTAEEAQQTGSATIISGKTV